MTTLVGWLGVQGDGPSSIYLASDSRISWPSPGRRWDAGRKLFALRHSADLFGYCGDALFPSQALGQVVEMADHHLLFRDASTAGNRHERVVQMLAGSVSRQHDAETDDFTVVHVARDGLLSESSFAIWTTTYKRGGELRDQLVERIAAAAPGPSRRLLALGKGSAAYVKETIRWNASAQGNTSRAYFTALCDVLERGDDPGSGGAPQLVGLYRNGNGRAYGVVHKGERYFHGLPLATMETYGTVEWRDDAFQRIDGRTLELMKSAQRQVRPRLPDY